MAIVYQMFPTFFYNGRPMSGGTINFYKNAQRNMTQSAYRDAGATDAFYTANIDENGQVENTTQIYLDDTLSYYVEVKDSGGTTRYTYQGLPAYNGGTVANNYYINPNLAPNPQFYQHKKTAVTASSTSGYSDKQEIAPPNWFFDQTATTSQTATVSFVTDTTADNAIGAQTDSTPAYNLKYTITGAGSSVSALRIYFEIPTVRALHNELITIRADVKGSEAFNINFFYQQNITGTPATQATISTEAVTTSWSTVEGSATIADITGTIVDNGDYIIIGVDLTGLYSSSSASFEMTNFQLYLGNDSIPYAYKTPAQQAVESIPTPNPDEDDGKILRVNNSGYYFLSPDSSGVNKIWGGDFSVNPFQDGTSLTAKTADTYIADGYEMIVTGTLGSTTFSGSQDSSAPTFAQADYNTANSLRVGIATADLTLQDDNLITIRHIVEGYDAKELYGGTATLSFWVYAKQTLTYYVAIRNAADDRQFIKSFTVDATETWEYKQIAIPAITAGGGTAFNTTNGVGLQIDWVIAAGADYVAASPSDGNWTDTSTEYANATVNGFDDSTSDDFQIALPVLNAGSGSITYPLVPREAVVAKAQRYYEKSYAQGTDPGASNIFPNIAIGLSGASATTGFLPLNTEYKVPKRSVPSALTVYSYAGTINKLSVLDSVWSVTGNTTPSYSSSTLGTNGIFSIVMSGNLATSTYHLFHWVVNSRF